MIRAKAIVLASLLVVSGACAGPSAEAGRGPSSATPAGATPAVAAPAGATPAVAAPAPARVEEPRVVCEYVKRSGSNIATRECREVNHFVDDAGKKGAENWFRSGPSSPSR
jgi:hypothetical protein